MKYILFFSILFVSVAKGQKPSTADTSKLLHIATSTLGYSALSIRDWSKIHENYWYMAEDSAMKTIWKWKYMSDTIYIDTTKIKHIIYIK